MQLTTATASLLLLATVCSVSARQLQKCEGDFDVKSDEDVAKLNVCADVKGNVKIEGLSAKELSLGNLRSVDGDVKISTNSELETISLPRVESVSGELFIGENSQLSSIDFTALKSVGKSIQLNLVESTQELKFPALQAVKDDLIVWGESNIENFDQFKSVQTVSGVFSLRGTFNKIELSDDFKTDSMAVVSTSKLDCAAIEKEHKPKVKSTLRCLDSAEKKLVVEGGRLPSGASTAQIGFGALATTAMLVSYLTI